MADERLHKRVLIRRNLDPPAQRLPFVLPAEPGFFQPGDHFVHQDRVFPVRIDLDARLFADAVGAYLPAGLVNELRCPFGIVGVGVS